MKVLPIMLRSFGRSGSTLLMQILGSNENVIFDRVYPFENRHLSYLHRIKMVIEQPTNNNHEWGPDSLFHRHAQLLGPIPYSETRIFEREKLADDLLIRLLNGFSETVYKENIEKLNIDKPIYYAEKVVMDICEDINNKVEAKNLFLLRDPRDEFLSIRSFNKKRNSFSFGWAEDDTDASFALKLCKMRQHYLKQVSSIEKDKRRLFVKYEDVISSPYEKTEEIGSWLGLTLDYSKVEDNKKNVSQHITKDTSEVRWKTEMEKSIQQIFTDNIGEELAQLGYEC